MTVANETTNVQNPQLLNLLIPLVFITLEQRIFFYWSILTQTKLLMIENYGAVYLHPDEYPEPEDLSERHGCADGMYPCDRFPESANDMVSNCPVKGPLAMNNSPDPEKRYGNPCNAHEGAVVGTGCMNLDCMCPNCHGDCKCGAGSNKSEQFVGSAAATVVSRPIDTIVYFAMLIVGLILLGMATRQRKLPMKVVFGAAGIIIIVLAGTQY